MKRSWGRRLSARQCVGCSARLNVGSASAGWAGISDIQYDDGGRNCTDGIEFSLTYFAALSISILLDHGRHGSGQSGAGSAGHGGFAAVLPAGA